MTCQHDYGGESLRGIGLRFGRRPLKILEMSDPHPEETSKRVREDLFAGNKIKAVKFYCEQTGVGLKEAKDAVEKLEAELRASSPEMFAKPPAAGGCGLTVLCALGVVLWLCVR